MTEGKHWNGRHRFTKKVARFFGRHEKCGVEVYKHPTSPRICQLPVGHREPCQGMRGLRNVAKRLA